jgi:hypothetical protein
MDADMLGRERASSFDPRLLPFGAMVQTKAEDTGLATLPLIHTKCSHYGGKESTPSK